MFYLSFVFLFCFLSSLSLYLSKIASVCLQCWGVGPPTAPGLPDWHFPPIFYSAAAQPRASPDGLCLQASPGPRRPTRPLESSSALHPCPWTHIYTLKHTFTLRYVIPTHISMQHTLEQPEQTQSIVSGGSFILITSPFVFIHTPSYSFIVALLFICSQEIRGRGFYDNAEDVEWQLLKLKRCHFMDYVCANMREWYLAASKCL